MGQKKKSTKSAAEEEKKTLVTNAGGRKNSKSQGRGATSTTIYRWSNLVGNKKYSKSTPQQGGTLTKKILSLHKGDTLH